MAALSVCVPPTACMQVACSYLWRLLIIACAALIGHLSDPKQCLDTSKTITAIIVVLGVLIYALGPHLVPGNKLKTAPSIQEALIQAYES